MAGLWDMVFSGWRKQKIIGLVNVKVAGILKRWLKGIILTTTTFYILYFTLLSENHKLLANVEDCVYQKLTKD
jgi:hypothetical protein